MTFVWARPEYETDDYLSHDLQFAGRDSYQLRTLLRCLPDIGNFAVAIDVGANVGVWSYAMSRMFAHVHAFEPIPQLAQCWRTNMSGIDNATLTQTALGAHRGELRMKAKHVSLKSRVDPNGSLTVAVNTLDEYHITGVNFLKIDCEGYETAVLMGASRLIERDRPLILVEQKPGAIRRYDFEHAVTYLGKQGYRLLWEHGGDYCMRGD